MTKVTPKIDVPVFTASSKPNAPSALQQRTTAAAKIAQVPAPTASERLKNAVVSVRNSAAANPGKTTLAAVGALAAAYGIHNREAVLGMISSEAPGYFSTALEYGSSALSTTWEYVSPLPGMAYDNLKTSVTSAAAGGITIAGHVAVNSFTFNPKEHYSKTRIGLVASVVTGAAFGVLKAAAGVYSYFVAETPAKV